MQLLPVLVLLYRLQYMCALGIIGGETGARWKVVERDLHKPKIEGPR